MFTYQHSTLTCESFPLPLVAEEVGTPVYVYARNEILRRARAYRQAAGEDALVCYAVKANGNPAILRLLAAEGLGADVTSGGELYLALHGGFAPQRIIYSGVGKSVEEIEMALEAGIGALHVESAMELDVIARTAVALGREARIAVRVNPDVGADTHPYDSTGRLQHKFGVPRETAVDLLLRASCHPGLQATGLAAHIGSQITTIEPYRVLAAFLAELAAELAALGVELSYIDAGGGLGINYQEDNAPTIAAWVAAVAEPVRRSGRRLVVEPGRSIIGPAGALLTRVLYTKEQGGKSFVIVDAGLNDLIRPAMYRAYHAIRPVSEPDDHQGTAVVDVVGPICETGDFLAVDRPLPPLQPGDLLAVMQAGAYGFAMSSNYNGRRRAAEVLVDGDRFQLIRRRQSYEHLLDGCS
jgi:diaminopimelate decarboxylase